MAAEKENGQALLLANLKGSVKQRLIYDAIPRVIAAYVAPVSAKQGDPCHLTRYGFRNANSSDITYRKEFSTVEDGAIWDPDDQGWDDDATNYEALPNPIN